MYQRVKQINNNKNDDLFGISFKISEHLFALERYFVDQDYIIVLIEVILLLCPYVLIALGYLFKSDLELRRNLNLKIYLLYLKYYFN